MQLVTERLQLREFEEDDWRAIFSYQIQPDYLGYYPWHRRTAENVRNFVNQFIRAAHEQPRTEFQLAITTKDDHRAVGTCGLRCVDLESQSAEFGCELNPDYWRQGFATEATRAMFNFGFDELQLHRIWAQCVAENSAITRVLGKVGMRSEGCLRDHVWMQQRWWDVNIYGILHEEWQTSAQISSAE